MKRKLSDLKENECIKVNTLKEAKYFCCKGNWIIDRPNPKEIKGEFIVFVEPNIIAWNRIDGLSKKELRNILPASDFIKPKKSKLKKVWQEIARLDKEVHDLKNADNKPDLFLGLGCEAEIIQEKEIDWGVSGQLVEYKTGAIWMTTGNHTEKEFEGILIVSKISESKRGDKFFGLDKADFNLSKKEILLKNE